MKANIRERTARTDWSATVRAVLIPAAALLGLALVCLLLVASARSRSTASSPIHKTALMIGDSLSVGKFGEVLREFLVSTFGVRNVAIYASCGSSPEHWLRSEPTFVTKCGYREQTPKRAIVLETRHKSVATPKLEDLVAIYRPSIVIVQLGTNWMDRLVSPSPKKEADFSSVLDRFVAAARSQPAGARQIIWINPPDSSYFSQRTQRTVEALIRSASKRDSFEIINSREMTHYVVGKSGGDGIHYDSQAAADWANRVIQRLSRRLRWATMP